VLDETTCRLVMQRYRYEPARDAQGRRVSDTDVEEHSWVLVD
jgi:protein TonB